jgi:hypothetical protein
VTLPEFPLRSRQKKVGLIFGVLTSFGFATWVVLTSPPLHVSVFLALACVAIGNAAVVYVAWPGANGFLLRERRKGGGRGSGPTGRGLAGDAGPAPAAAGRQPVLRAVSRLMPTAAGRRWLAEVQSVLFETATRQRGKAVRSYLRTAPRVILATWAGELSRRARRPRLPAAGGGDQPVPAWVARVVSRAKRPACCRARAASGRKLQKMWKSWVSTGNSSKWAATPQSRA